MAKKERIATQKMVLTLALKMGKEYLNINMHFD